MVRAKYRFLVCQLEWERRQCHICRSKVEGNSYAVKGGAKGKKRKRVDFNRYGGVVRGEEDRTDVLSVSNLFHAIRDSIALNFGDEGVAATSKGLQVKYYCSRTNLFVLRVPR